MAGRHIASSGVILAGGHSRRMGVDKASLRRHGETLLERTARVLLPITDEVLVVGRSEATSALHACRFVQDCIPEAGPLGGLLTALTHAQGRYLVVAACDLPFLKRDVVLYLLGAAGGFDAVVPVVAGRRQPLHAVYARSTLPVVQRHASSGRLQMQSLLDELNVRWVQLSEIEHIDPKGHSFINVNTPEEWQAAAGSFNDLSNKSAETPPGTGSGAG